MSGAQAMATNGRRFIAEVANHAPRAFELIYFGQQHQQFRRYLYRADF
jgi:hypothetical protein